MDIRRLLALGGVALATVVVVTAVGLTLVNSTDGSENDDRISNEDSTGGGAFGICLEGTTDCVDTITDGGPSGPDDEAPAGPDEPVSKTPDDPGSGSDAIDCSAEENAEGCEARGTDLALNDLSSRLGVDVEAIAVVSVEDTVWDGCMGIAPPEGQACTEIGIFGYRIILEHAGATYEYHTDQGARAVLAP